MRIRVEFKIDHADADEPPLGSDAYGAFDWDADFVTPASALAEASRKLSLAEPDLKPGSTVTFLVLQRPG